MVCLNIDKTNYLFDENSYRGNVYNIAPSGLTVPGNFSRTLVTSITVSVHATYLVIRGADWMPNSNGIRVLTAVPLEGARSQVDIKNTVSEHEQLCQQFTTIEPRGVGEIVECYAAQNSGENINIYPYIYAVILKKL